MTGLIFLEHTYLLYCPEESNFKINEGSVHLCLCVCVLGEAGGRRAKSKKKQEMWIIKTIPLGGHLA